MKIETHVATNYSITLSEDEIRYIVEHPAQAIKLLRKEIRRMEDESPLRIVSTTRARPKVNSKLPCPKCGLMMEARGLGVHFYKRHRQKLLDWKEHHPDESGLLLPAGANGHS